MPLQFPTYPSGAFVIFDDAEGDEDDDDDDDGDDDDDDDDGYDKDDDHDDDHDDDDDVFFARTARPRAPDVPAPLSLMSI